jgi:hypothetical protein
MDVRQPPAAEVTTLDNYFDEEVNAWARQDLALSLYLDLWQEKFGQEPHWNCKFEGNSGSNSEEDRIVYSVSGLDDTDLDPHYLVVYGDGGIERGPLSD